MILFLAPNKIPLSTKIQSAGSSYIVVEFGAASARPQVEIAPAIHLRAAAAAWQVDLASLSARSAPRADTHTECIQHSSALLPQTAG